MRGTAQLCILVSKPIVCAHARACVYAKLVYLSVGVEEAGQCSAFAELLYFCKLRRIKSRVLVDPRSRPECFDELIEANLRWIPGKIHCHHYPNPIPVNP